MKTAVPVFQMLTRLCGLILIVLGILFWTGNSTGGAARKSGHD
ncbi:MAG TPA: hypothetical protein VMT46_05145 [Anaerolineaceae bacterium]|nr:hypothetical protein [Anaerolineaceae bacterium]